MTRDEKELLVLLAEELRARLANAQDPKERAFANKLERVYGLVEAATLAEKLNP